MLDPTVVSSPVALGRRIVSLAGDPDFRAALLATLVAWLLALLVTVLVAVPAGLLLGSIPAVRTATEVSSGAAADPGRDADPVVPGHDGLRSTDQDRARGVRGHVAADVQRADRRARHRPPVDRHGPQLGTGTLRTTLRVRLPAVVPFAVTGLRVAAPLELIVLVSTEFVAGEGTRDLART